MTKELFLEILKDGLYDFPEGELSDILYDYKEHFDVGFSSGKTEEEIIEELGEPNDIVAQYRNGYLKKYESTDEDNSTYNSSTNQTNENTDKNTYTKSETNNQINKSNNFIVSALIIVFSLILFGPIGAGIALGLIGMFFGLIGGSLGLMVASSGILIGKFVTNTVGIFQFPEFMLNFPDSVLVLIFFGSLFLFIFSILCLYYLIKLFVRLIRKLVDFTSKKLRGE